MAVFIVRLGSQRKKNEGLRIGTVRRPPRGVRKEDFGRLNYYDTWLPQLAPSEELVRKARAVESDAGWREFEKAYLRELARPDSSRLLDLLAALSRQTSFSIGCYCENENRCHRSLLRQALAERGAVLGV